MASGLPNFRLIFAASRTPAEERRVRWTALAHAAAFLAICTAAVVVRDGLWAHIVAAVASPLHAVARTVTTHTRGLPAR